jgi:urate oxidase
MAQRILQEIKDIKEVTYTLPNKHYIPVDMQYIGVENVKPLSYYIPALSTAMTTC